MPFYEYTCQNEACEHNWEEEQRMSDPKITTCPECHQETAKRLISVSNFHLIGSGWAKDNYK